ncbi:hypothetical protein DEO72_LG6g1963 [Vigna unguiculata]|uniref:Uncharacterized protein n=1 Tax=Vigna unguiculata TaxID=3917 RepID=A0A4D6M8W3_VIGUN|nr:hypothetical protein DEO72_LG6g1963 [Vigna unguiculata]
MGHSPQDIPRTLSGRVASSLMTTMIPRVCSHQSIDDHRKDRNTTYKATKKKRESVRSR